MIRRILVATDFSDSSTAAQLRAEELARLTHAELLLVYVRDEFPFVASDGSGFVPHELLGQHAADRAEVERLAAEIVTRGLVARGVLVLGSAAPRLLAVAEQEQVDLIVVGTNGRRGVQHLVLGSVAEQVVRTSPVPVMVVAGRERPSFASLSQSGLSRTILVATDFEAASLAAIPYAFELAAVIGARVNLLHVYAQVVLPDAELRADVLFDPLHHRALTRLRELAGPYHRSEHLDQCIATMGDAAQIIGETALELDANLIVVGTHGRAGVKHLLLGSVAEKVIRAATCPVVVARGIEQTGGHIALPDELEQARARDSGHSTSVRRGDGGRLCNTR